MEPRTGLQRPLLIPLPQHAQAKARGRYCPGLAEIQGIETRASGYGGQKQMERLGHRCLAPRLYGLVRGDLETADADIDPLAAGEGHLKSFAHVLLCP